MIHAIVGGQPGCVTTSDGHATIEASPELICH